MKEIKKTLNIIAEAFELGTVLSFRTDDYTVRGYNKRLYIELILTNKIDKVMSKIKSFRDKAAAFRQRSNDLTKEINDTYNEITKIGDVSFIRSALTRLGIRFDEDDCDETLVDLYVGEKSAYVSDFPSVDYFNGIRVMTFYVLHIVNGDMIGMDEDFNERDATIHDTTSNSDVINLIGEIAEISTGVKLGEFIDKIV